MRGASLRMTATERYVLTSTLPFEMIENFPTPLALVAELTHRCPLHCVYCSNPINLANRAFELSTEDWSRVFREAAELGVLQADFTGGEPLARTDIVELVRSARAAGLYVSLISSGLPLDEAKLAALVEVGLDHFQLSFQGAREETAREISGTKTHAQKLRVLEWLKKHRIGVTLNFVIHRRNIDELDAMLALVEEHVPGCVEFASVQYYGYGLANRANLLPTRAQLDHCVETLKKAEERLKGKTRIVFVVPDYYARYPKPCVGGWGRKLMLITPEGKALPCHAASVIPGMQFENVNEKNLLQIWEDSDSFRAFRGEGWMQEPCKTCDRRSLDFGGCRCQAFLLTGDAQATDPVCSLAPTRPIVDAILVEAAEPSPLVSVQSVDWIYRPNPG
jgi:pyrroloquinoline quinone biosynthesis protein E